MVMGEAGNAPAQRQRAVLGRATVTMPGCFRSPEGPIRPGEDRSGGPEV
ncbi:MAG: hypothetical protein QOI68_3384, partial [Pseudonocardiales bacterium]|nr:hypothetical protein [Pseudonocardiales bacterium]